MLENPIFNVPVLDLGRLRCVQFSGGDLLVVNAARTSFGVEKTELDEKDKGLINFLLRNRHTTPFEHSTFTFYVKAPIFVAREWFRHRWSAFSWEPTEDLIESFNEYSMRYSKALEDYYIPDKKDVRSQVGKPGAYRFELLSLDITAAARMEIRSAYDDAIGRYQTLLKMGVAKELARSVLPVGLYTIFYWTANARALMHFLSLRNHDTALLEIREYAVAIEKMFELLMPVTYAAFVDLGRLVA
jgi:thymidylate synthase (FAD)